MANHAQMGPARPGPGEENLGVVARAVVHIDDLEGSQGGGGLPQTRFSQDAPRELLDRLVRGSFLTEASMRRLRASRHRRQYRRAGRR